MLIPICLLLNSFVHNVPFEEYNVTAEPKEEETGQQLAARYCVACHDLPDPQSLNKKTWKESVLPNMGLRLGLKINGKYWKETLDEKEVSIVSKMNLYPTKPIISKEEWKLLTDYYISSAPSKLKKQDKNNIEVSKDFPFKAQPISLKASILPQVTLLKFSEERKELYVGDNLNLFKLDIKGTSEKQWKIDSPASDIEFPKAQEPLLLTIGNLSPSDQSLGSLNTLNSRLYSDRYQNLKRPVDFEFADLNQDGKMDLLLCQYGHYGGKLSWFSNFEESKEQVLSSLPGTRKAEVKDFNFDGKPDIVALMAQAREQIVLFVNKGNGKFEEIKLLEFAAINGTNYFELTDFNGDGFQDIMVTNGDNRDYSNISKPYHGIRIYLNDGKNVFNERFFFPMYDCSKAIVADFDKDGDLDIIGAALFGNYSEDKNINESIVYLENDGNMTFTASYLPQIIHGNWLTMEVGDFNNDNLLDVILGSFVFDLKEAMTITQKTQLAEIPQLLLLTQFQ